MNKILYISTLVLSVSLLFTSCKKDDDSSNTSSTSQTGELILHFHGKAGSEDLALNKEFKLNNGTRVKFEKVFFYTSGIKLKKNMNGSEIHEVADQFHLIDPSKMMYSVGQVPAHNYHGITFDLGIDNVTNTTKEPANYDVNHPLGPKDPSMYWSWKSGYRFVLIEGLVDISADNTGDVNEKFVMHIGTKDLLRNVDSKMFHFEVKGGQKKEVVIDYDILKIFNNIDLKVEENRKTHTMNNKPLAIKTIDNAMTMFSFE